MSSFKPVNSAPHVPLCNTLRKNVNVVPTQEFNRAVTDYLRIRLDLPPTHKALLESLKDHPLMPRRQRRHKTTDSDAVSGHHPKTPTNLCCQDTLRPDISPPDTQLGHHHGLAKRQDSPLTDYGESLFDEDSLEAIERLSYDSKIVKLQSLAESAHETSLSDDVSSDVSIGSIANVSTDQSGKAQTQEDTEPPAQNSSQAHNLSEGRQILFPPPKLPLESMVAAADLDECGNDACNDGPDSRASFEIPRMAFSAPAQHHNSPIVGITTSPRLYTCFAIEHVIDAAANFKDDQVLLVELFARIRCRHTLSTLAPRPAQLICYNLMDLNRDRPPYLKAEYRTAEDDTGNLHTHSLLDFEQDPSGKFCRCFGHMAVERGAWSLIVFTIREVCQEDVQHAVSMVNTNRVNG